jgi:predicted 2-oxoglutarate/Fe(II)-dependent dioxygenase YbiX
MATPQQRPVTITVGDPMPRIVLPEAAGAMFDSWDQTVSGRVHVYWLSGSQEIPEAKRLAASLAALETELHVVAPVAPSAPGNGMSWLIDQSNDLGRAVGMTHPCAVVVDAAGRLAALLPQPTSDDLVVLATRLYDASTSTVVQAQAPVLLLDKVVEASLCDKLIEHWRRGDKLTDSVASAAAASSANADTKRRIDVPVDDAELFMPLRDCLVRRVLPAILQAFQTRIVQIEMPRIGCYDASSGGWFRRHRDNTTRYTAHRQFALSINLNAPDDYDGGEVRFPEFGRQLYRPPAGGAVAFSCGLLHEVVPVTRGRRFGVFTFLHDQSRDAQYRQMNAEQKALGNQGIRMRGTAG